jgi:2-oxoglutarate ferredoxin oxidoreductase subunit beta
MEKIYKRPDAMQKRPSGYCPGCLHGVANKLILGLVDEFGIADDTVMVQPIGCGALMCWTTDTDQIISLHGRAPATATGIKRSAPEKFVLVYQGDGDLAAIGTAETVHIAARGENVTTIFINNAIYGMTGGQMAPTTLAGQVTQTSPYGRDLKTQGNPIRVSEMLATLDGPAYIERVTVDTVPNIKKAKAAIKKAFQLQMEGKGFTLVEVVSTCPTNWGMSPQESFDWMRENMLPHYPLGVYKDITAKEDK